MAKYKIGDKVRIVKRWGFGCHQAQKGEMDCWLGKVMTVAKVDTCATGTFYRMEEDKGDWLWFENAIERGVNPVNEKIVITREGNKVLARHYVGDRIAEETMARCSDGDEFDFNYGASLAAHRLFADARKHTVLSDLRKRLNDGGMAIVSVLSSLRGNL